MNAPVKWLVWASIVNMIGNSLGTVVALQHNLISDLGGTLHGQNVLQDFLGTQGTALSAPLPFMLIQLVLTGLALRAGRSRMIGVIGLTFVGLLYTPAQAGERIVLRLLSPGGFDLVQFIIALVNIASAVALLVLGILAWRALRASRSTRAERPVAI